MKRGVLVTGGTGMLGRSMIPTLLENPETDIYILTRLPRPSSIPRLTYIGGNMASPLIFDNPEDMKRISNTVTNAIHMVASTKFTESEKKETEIMNIGGTANIVEFLKVCPNLENFFHVSTAYVSNTSQGIDVALENEMPPKKAFANPYESSKYESELLVRASELPWTILRPGIFAGDSITGSTGLDRRMGYGVLIGLLQSAVRTLPEIGSVEKYWALRNKLKDASPADYPDANCRLRGFPEVYKNFMFIDDIAAQMMSIINSQKEKIGKTFHIVTKSPITCQQMLDAMQFALKIKGFRFAGETLEGRLNKTERLAERLVGRIYTPYFLWQEPIYETRNADCCLNGYKRRDMSPERFSWLMEQYVNNELPEILRRR